LDEGIHLAVHPGRNRNRGGQIVFYCFCSSCPLAHAGGVEIGYCTKSRIEKGSAAEMESH
jgi:hypothetical protein